MGSITPKQQARSKRRLRWWVALSVGFGVFAAVMLILAGAAYFERVRVATLVVQRYLGSYGIDSELEFGRLGWGGFLVRVRAGPADAPDFTAEGADVTLIYPEPGLIGEVEPEVASVRLIRPFLRARFDGEKLSFGSLQPLIDDALSSDSTTPKPKFAIENGNLLLATPNGTLDLEADAILDKGQLEHLKATLKKTTLKLASFAADISGGRVSADYDGTALNAVLSLNVDALKAEGRSAHGLASEANIRGLKWQNEGPSYTFSVADAVITLAVGAAEAPEGAVDHSTARLTLAASDGSFDRGRLKVRARADLAAELSKLRAGEVSIAAIKTQASFSPLTVDASSDAWSANATAHIAAEGSGGSYQLMDRGLSLASLKTELDASGSVASTGVSGNLRGNLSASGNLARIANVRSLRAEFDGTGAYGREVANGTLQASLTASGNVPRGTALDLAHRVPGLGADEAFANAVATALQAANLTMRNVTVTQSDSVLTLTARSPLTLDGMGGANLVLSPRGARPLVEIRGRDMTGAVGVDIHGDGLPALRLAVSAYRYRQDQARTIADADAEYEAALDYGTFRGIRVSGAGKLQMAGDHIVFAAPACTNVNLAALPTSRTDQFRDIKGQVCGTMLRMTGDEMTLDLPGCADVAFSSLLNNSATIINDGKGKLCGANGSPLFVSKPAGWQLDGRWSDASLRLVSAETALGEVSGRVQLSGIGGEIKSGDVIIDGARLSDFAREPRYRPISASGAMKAAGSDWRGNFTLTAANRRLATVALRHSLSSGIGDAVIEARELAFAPNQFQPADVAPFLSTFGSRVRGGADFSGRVGWTKDGFTSDGRLQLAGIDFQSRIGMVRQMNADLAFSSLMPFALGPNQAITVNRIELVVPVEQVSARFTYTPEALRLEAATASMAEGTIVLDPMNYLLAPGSTTEGTLRLKNINAAPLIAAAGLADRMSVSAHIDGTVPFTLGPNGVRFMNGQVAANAPGRLSIKREALTSSVGVGNAGKAPPNAVQDFAYQALENLSFDQLDGTVNSLPMGRLGLLLHVKGRNDPAQTPQETRIGVIDLIRGRGFDKPLPLPKGTPIDLTLDTSLNLDELLNSYFNRVGSAAQEPMN